MESRTDVQNLMKEIELLEKSTSQKIMQQQMEIDQKDKSLNKINIMFSNLKTQY